MNVPDEHFPFIGLSFLSRVKKKKQFKKSKPLHINSRSHASSLIPNHYFYYLTYTVLIYWKLINLKYISWKCFSNKIDFIFKRYDILAYVRFVIDRKYGIIFFWEGAYFQHYCIIWLNKWPCSSCFDLVICESAVWC